jgi:glycosyltransferase involved in cell wall biosynthesis
VFVAAMRALRRRRDVRVALVGLGGEAFVEADDDIVVTGHVATEEYRRWMRDAAVMVQLRQTTNGESSGVVADALVHGTPLVVTDIGALGELPDEVAVRVPVDIGVEELAVVIETLLDDHDRRERMSVAGRAVAERETPAAQAQRVVDALFGPAAGHTG